MCDLCMDDVKGNQLLVWSNPYMVYITFLVFLMCFIAVITFLGTFGPKIPFLGLKHMSVVCNFHIGFITLILMNIHVIDLYIAFYAWLFVFYRFCPFWPLIGDCPFSPIKYEIFEKKPFFSWSQIIIPSNEKKVSKNIHPFKSFHSCFL